MDTCPWPDVTLDSPTPPMSSTRRGEEMSDAMLLCAMLPRKTTPDVMEHGPTHQGSPSCAGEVGWAVAGRGAGAPAASQPRSNAAMS